MIVHSKASFLAATTLLLLCLTSQGPQPAQALLVRDPTRNHQRTKGNNRSPCSTNNGSSPVGKIAQQGSVHSDMRLFMSPQTAAASLAALPIKMTRAASFMKQVAQVLHWQGLSFFWGVGWFLVPLMEQPYQNYVQDTNGEDANNNNPTKSYKNSKFRIVMDHISQASKIAFSVYVVDALRMAVQALGVTATNLPLPMDKIPRAYLRVAYTFWGVDRLAALKRHYVAYKTNSHPERLPAKLQLFNRAVDVALYSVGFFTVVAITKTDLGAATKGLVALGSFGTLAISLATQNVASQVVSGLFLDLTNRLKKGDKVRFGKDGGNLKVERMGWLHTVMRGPDDVKVNVPNKALVDKEVSNLSRAKTSSVKQQLKFQYGDVDKLPDLMETIKEEIEASCPTVITDGSRPFRAHFENFGSKLEVTVDAHFHLEPATHEYYDNRQEVLLAIKRATEKHHVEFA